MHSDDAIVSDASARSHDPVVEYERKVRPQMERALKRKAAASGYELVPKAGPGRIIAKTSGRAYDRQSPEQIITPNEPDR
ncbi:MAG: hypothetical protein JWO38_5527 [Gemmataceae bacterium]|nr:hypothetical protein [Gemmataceae bacterium]